MTINSKTVATFAAIMLLLPFSAGFWLHPAFAGHGLPHATVRVWNVTDPIGFNPGEAVEDVDGLTEHVVSGADKLTIVYAIENSDHPGGPCGLIYQNPATNTFKDYGVTGGATFGIDLNRSAPEKTGPDGGVFGAPTFKSGDVWVAVNRGSLPQVYVNFKGSDDFRLYEITGANGIRVDQATGDIWLTSLATSLGSVARLDPATNAETRWVVGGSPHFLAIDPASNVYTAAADSGAAGVDQIIRIDPDTNVVTRWDIPGGASLTPGSVFATPDGITIDSAGRIWFTESLSDEIGMLDVGTDTFTEFAKFGLDEPQLIAASGSGILLQSYSTENAGNSATLVTPDAIAKGWTPAPLVTVVEPTSEEVTPSKKTVTFKDSVIKPRKVVIEPTTFDVEGVDGTLPDPLPADYPKTPDGIAIPGILRFAPMPLAGLGENNPSGITDVVAASTIYGSYLDAGFEGNSAVFELKSGAIIAPPPGPPVGGEILPIDMTSLFVAGAFTNAFWILPMLAGIAGATIFVTRFRRKARE